MRKPRWWAKYDQWVETKTRGTSTEAGHSGRHRSGLLDGRPSTRLERIDGHLASHDSFGDELSDW